MTDQPNPLRELLREHYERHAEQMKTIQMGKRALEESSEPFAPHFGKVVEMIEAQQQRLFEHGLALWVVFNKLAGAGLIEAEDLEPIKKEWPEGAGPLDTH